MIKENVKDTKLKIPQGVGGEARLILSRNHEDHF